MRAASQARPAAKGSARASLDRSAATATDKASFGSFLLVSPACNSRTRAASFGGTSSTRSPAAASCWASRHPSPAAPSIAQARSGHPRAHASSCSACDGQASTCSSPSRSSPAPIATAVCEPLCGSTPIITCAISTLPAVVTKPEAAAGMPNTSASARASFEPHRSAARRAGRLVIKPGHNRDRQAVREPSPPGLPERYGRPQRSRVLLGGSARVLPGSRYHSA